ncbi:hypothetical protein SRHO_G00004700 [Serrasalmus rhombeus]
MELCDSKWRHWGWTADLALPDESWQWELMVCSDRHCLHGKAAVVSTAILFNPGWDVSCGAKQAQWDQLQRPQHPHQHCWGIRHPRPPPPSQKSALHQPATLSTSLF